MPTRSMVDPVASDNGSADSRIVREVARRCEEHIDVLAERVMAQWQAHLPGYLDLRDTEHPAALRQAIQFFLRTAQGFPAHEDLRMLFRRRAAHRAEQGVPLATLLRIYTIAAPALFDGLRQTLRNDEMAALAEIARLLFNWQDE